MTLPTTGFGAAPFGLHPFGIPLEEFSPEGPTILRSSRDVDLVRGGYDVDSDGNFVGMDDVAQRVILAVRTAVVPDLQGLDFDESMKAEILRVLRPLTPSQNPDITVRNIVVVRFPGGVRNRVFYRNNLVGTETSVSVTSR